MSHAQDAKSGSGPEVFVESVRVLMPSPLGPLGVELIGAVVTRLRFGPDPSTFTPLHQLDGSDVLDEIFGRLSEYFAGARRKLEVAIDLGPCGASVLVRRILKETARIPYGKTRTYQVLAEAAHVPEGAAKVAAVLQENPIPILIPCHRAVEGAQQIGNYIGGTDRKRWLLDMEQQEVEE